MMKRAYTKPTMRVVLLQQQCRILAGSAGVTNFMGAPEGIGWENDGLDDSAVLR